MIKLAVILWGHLIDFATRLPELYTDQDSKLSHSKGGMLVAGIVFTIKMIHDFPNDWELWAVYMGTVGGYALGKDMIARRFQNKQEVQDGPA